MESNEVPDAGDAATSSRAAGGREPLAHVDPIPVRVRFERLDVRNRWVDATWRLAGVEPLESRQAPAPDALAIELHRDEAQGYLLNATSPEPSIFVMWRLDETANTPCPLAITLSYDEAGRWMDGGETVDRVPMPAPMVGWLAEYASLHHRPETRRKRRGNRPSFMARDEFDAMRRREAGGSRAPDDDAGAGR